MAKIKIGIFGYGNLGRGVEEAVLNAPDMELVKVFSRRDNLKTVNNQEIENVKNIKDYQNKIDVLILCGGSATDLPKQSPEMIKMFNIVDSFDTHAKIPEQFAVLDQEAKKSGYCGIMSVGWDPGLFSMSRVLFSSFLPNGEDYTFWGKGVSQGHSDAIRRVEGVKRGIQYTVPIPEAIEKVRHGEMPQFETRDKHERVCYIVAKDGADQEKIKDEIVNMPNYFSDYNTIVNFITEEEFDKEHNSIPHGGFVMRSGTTDQEKNKYLLELAIKLDSNPGFTGSVLVAFARATYKMHNEGKVGAFTAYDVPIGYLSEKSPEDLRAHTL